MPQPSAPPSRSIAGLLQALGAYAAWCLFPPYFALMHAVAPFEVVAWRLVSTLPFCLAVILAMRQGAALRLALTTPRILGALALSGLMIGTNWLTYVIAVLDGHVLAASLGYYITPLVNVLAGTIFLHEKLTRRQWIAVGLATIGVALLAQGALETLGISLVLALTFSAYGLVRKLLPVDALTGLTVETIVLLVPGLGLLAWQASSSEGLAMGTSLRLDLLLLCAGPLTAVPLMLYGSAARKLEFAVLGFLQFVTPTGLFLLGIFYFGEPLRPIQLVCFMFIWSAIAVFCWDIFSRRRVA